MRELAALELDDVILFRGRPRWPFSSLSLPKKQLDPTVASRDCYCRGEQREPAVLRVNDSVVLMRIARADVCCTNNAGKAAIVDYISETFWLYARIA